MNDLLMQFVLLALAVYRVAMLLTRDDGPFDIFLRLRVWAGVYDLDEQGSIMSPLGKLFECPYCVGLYASLPAAFILLYVPFTLEGLGWIWLGVLWFALAGAQAVLETVAGHK